MIVTLHNDSSSLARAAADHASGVIRAAIADHGLGRIVFATAASQFPFLEALTKAPGIDWSKVEAFHLDEYVGIPATHPGSFRKMLMERVVAKTGITKYHFLEGDAADLTAAVRNVGEQLTSAPIDVAFVGIGENAHLAFNDPPADFEIDDPYMVVKLDEACRQQQVGEGWFADLSKVPTHALSMSVKQVLKAREILAVVPDQRKAAAVQASVEGKISPMTPASILRRHPKTTIYLDPQSSSMLSADLRRQLQKESRAVVG